MMQLQAGFWSASLYLLKESGTSLAFLDKLFNWRGSEGSYGNTESLMMDGFKFFEVRSTGCSIYQAAVIKS